MGREFDIGGQIRLWSREEHAKPGIESPCGGLEATSLPSLLASRLSRKYPRKCHLLIC